MMRRALHNRTLAHGAILLAVMPLMAGASASSLPNEPDQEQEFVTDPESAKTMELLSRRNRETIHPGNPHNLIGLGEGDNNFRSGLNALGRGEYIPAAVDRTDAYERQLAMHQGGTTFDRPMRRSFLPRDTADGAAPPPRAADDAQSDELPVKKPFDTTWIGMLIAAAASVGLFLTRGHGPSRV